MGTVLDLYNTIVTGTSPVVVAEAKVLLKSAQLTSCSHKVVCRLGKRHVGNCTCCELTKQNLVVHENVRVAPTVHITCKSRTIICMNEIAEKNPQIHVEGIHYVDSSQSKTNRKRKIVVITMWVSLTKCQTMTFILNGSD